MGPCTVKVRSVRFACIEIVNLHVLMLQTAIGRIMNGERAVMLTGQVMIVGNIQIILLLVLRTLVYG